LSASVLALTAGSTFAQQTTGTPGSPSATTTIDGKYLPQPPAPFGGTINLDAKDSKAYWPPTWSRPRVRPTSC
jgi:arylsulfatase